MKTRSVGRPAKMATCHQAKEYFHQGLCLDCYLKKGGTPVALATACKHKQRRHYGGGLCESCCLTLWRKQNPEKAWRKLHPDRARESRRRQSLRRLGITPAKYSSLWDLQQGKCANAACYFKAPLKMSNYRTGLAVDHCHKTGAIRGLLCARCNSTLGQIDDDLVKLRGLIDYLVSHSLRMKMALITTTHGDMDEALLEKREGIIDNENETTCWTEYWLVDELVHRSAHVQLKKWPHAISGLVGELG